MGEATKQYFLKVFGETVGILRQESIAHLVVGSIASASHLDFPWDPASDIDLLVTKEDAERCLEIFPSHGYATHIRDAGWIYKVAKPNVVVDLIFVAANAVKLDDEMLAHAVELPFETLTLSVASIEDMALLLALMDSEERRGYWYDAMAYLRCVRDWDYLVHRARRYRPGKMLSALLYARETGIEIPDSAISGVLEGQSAPSAV